MAGLPSAIDVEKFVEARAFEINAMQTAMKTARCVYSDSMGLSYNTTAVLDRRREHGKHYPDI